MKQQSQAPKQDVENLLNTRPTVNGGLMMAAAPIKRRVKEHWPGVSKATKAVIVGKLILWSHHTDVATRPNLTGNLPPPYLGPEIIIHKQLWGDMPVSGLWDWPEPPKTEPSKRFHDFCDSSGDKVNPHTHTHTRGTFPHIKLQVSDATFSPTLPGIYFRLSSAQASIHHKTAHPWKQCSMTHSAFHPYTCQCLRW